MRFLMVLSMAVPLVAAESAVPRYRVPSIADRITVDGKLDEAGWARARPIALGFPWDQQTGAKQATTVRLLHDRAKLYVGYECEDADITAVHQHRDDPTYQDDCVEIFLKPGEADVYVGLEMNARGVLYDYLYPFPNALDKTLDLEGVELRTSIDGTLNSSGDRDRRWTLELAVPFSNFGRLAPRVPPGAGESWRAQINRWDGVEDRGGRRLSMWTPSGLRRPGPHNPERFGYLLFE
jgi:hypothetical protein